MNYYERHIGDYYRDTSHLSLLEHGIYTRLLDIYYTREESLPHRGIARLVGARSDEEAEAVCRVLDEFFVQEGEFWVHRRCQSEIERFHEKQAQAKRAAQASVASRQASAERALNERSTDAERALSVPRHQTPDTNKERTPRATRLAPDWVLPDEWREWARKERPEIDPLKTAEDFRDYWIAKPGREGTKLDWLATWRKWVRTTRAPPTKPADVARQTVPLDPRNLYVAPPPMTPEERAASDKVRRMVMASIKTA